MTGIILGERRRSSTDTGEPRQNTRRASGGRTPGRREVGAEVSNCAAPSFSSASLVSRAHGLRGVGSPKTSLVRSSLWTEGWDRLHYYRDSRLRASAVILQSLVIPLTVIMRHLARCRAFRHRRNPLRFQHPSDRGSPDTMAHVLQKARADRGFFWCPRSASVGDQEPQEYLNKSLCVTWVSSVTCGCSRTSTL